MDYDQLQMSAERKVLLCGTNVYPNPEYHPDRVMTNHDLLYIVSGSWQVAQDDEVYNLREGDMIFLRAGSHHWGPSLCSVNAYTMFIHLNVLPGDRKLGTDLTRTERDVFNTGRSFCMPTVIRCGQASAAQEVTGLMQKVVDVYWSRRDDRERAANLYTNLLLNELAWIGRSADSAVEAEWTVRVIQLFRENIRRTYTLEELARIVGVSVRTLSDRFREVTGQSIRQYQLNMKLDAAYAELRGGSRSVKEVADTYGFCDAYYFSRMFRQKFGVPPKQIRDRNPAANIDRPPVV